MGGKSTTAATAFLGRFAAVCGEMAGQTLESPGSVCVLFNPAFLGGFIVLQHTTATYVSDLANNCSSELQQSRKSYVTTSAHEFD